jgi:2-dehydropantoate 2-reductase
MRFAILGAGGVGSYYAARLLQAGEDVTLIARDAHLAVLQTQGLTVTHPAFQFKNHVRALNLGEFMRRFSPVNVSVIVFCVKANATEGIARQMVEWAGSTSSADTCYLSLQNGVDNETILAEKFGAARVIGGLAVRIGAHIAQPGHVEAVGPAQVIVGEWPQSGQARDTPAQRLLNELPAIFNRAGIPTQRVKNIRRELWRKLIINNGVNPLSALTGLDTRALTYHPEFGPIAYALMEEAARAGRADGLRLGKRDVQEMYTLMREFDGVKTSMLVDRERHRPLELEAICGAVLERSRRLGLSAPYTTTVYSLLKHAIS